MSSNFTFLRTEWPDLFESAAKTEQLAASDARLACFYARYTLELAVTWLFAHDPAFRRPYDANLSALIHEPSFQKNVPNDVYVKVQYIRRQGNMAAHQGKAPSAYEALQTTKELWHVLYWLARTYTREGAQSLAGLTFNQQIVQQSAQPTAQQTLKQIQELEKTLEAKLRTSFEQELTQTIQSKDDRIRFADSLIEARDRKLTEAEQEIVRLNAEIAKAKAANVAIPDTHDYDEAATRDLFIDLLLKEAGWQIGKNLETEVAVTGLPNKSGKGLVDYVLWGKNGLPFAVVEAKRTKRDANEGREQAKQYADALEARFKVRPLIFYTNGYTTWFWDDSEYPPRQVQGFYSEDELALLMQRRNDKRRLTGEPINREIIDRYYQEEAIRAVAEHFEKKQRKALVVMATGSGKTRTVIALCELLQRANWVKRILFLADRKALVKQAQNAFKRHLPNSATVNLLEEKEDSEARVYVSTYPTMMNMIDERVDGDQSRFGPGYFDLIIIDEAHRSVYQKYSAIFRYFDSLLVGLTATPKSEVDINTYSLFNLESGVPTYSYELEQAVKDKYLVPPQAESVTLKLPTSGIKYDDLTEEEKENYESIDWGDGTGEIPEKIEGSAINNWLFNESTVDLVLKDLMERGIKVAGGDRLGKTIIFAAKHDHAEFICERFNAHYPHYVGHFARVIDNYESKSASLIEKFSLPSKDPHIAISVDMLDTGIDVPEVVNLVFFKVVRSRTKFFQMIGRGTRLSPDLFGPGQDKTHFLIFDYCGNFDFFGVKPDGVEGSAQESISKRIFKYRLELIDRLQEATENDDRSTMLAELRHILRSEVQAMNLNNFLVREKREYVERFKNAESWESLTKEDIAGLGLHVAGLPTDIPPEDDTAKRFDVLLLQIELGLLVPDVSLERMIGKVKEIASQLESKASIPQVEAQMETIQNVQSDEFWQDITVVMADDVRKHLRLLVQFIDKNQRAPIYTNFIDEATEFKPVPMSTIGLSFTSEFDLKQYRKKVTQFLRSHEEVPAIQKLKYNLPITRYDLDQLEKMLLHAAVGGVPDQLTIQQITEQQPLGLFIRKLIGLDREAVLKEFSEFLAAGTYTANQIRFVDQVINYLTANGSMDPGKLYDQPFTAYSPDGVEGLFSPSQTDALVHVVESINAYAAAVS